SPAGSDQSGETGLGRGRRRVVEGRAGRGDESAERGGVGDGQVGEDLAIDLDARLAEAGDEAAVADVVLATGGVDPLDPELAELTLAGAAVAERVLQRVHDLLVRGAVRAALVAVVALGPLEGGPAVLLAVDGALDPGHRRLLSGVGGRCGRW